MVRKRHVALEKIILTYKLSLVDCKSCLSYSIGSSVYTQNTCSKTDSAQANQLGLKSFKYSVVKSAAIGSKQLIGNYFGSALLLTTALLMSA
jgi:hypothetical protein